MAAVYLCDRNYHDLTTCSIASLARSHCEPIDIFLFQHEYERALTEKLASFIAAKGHRCIIRSADVAVSGSIGGRKRPGRDYVSETSLLKPSCINELVDEYRYITYLDSDVLVFKDLKLYELSDFNELCAGCLDFPMVSGYEDRNFFQNCANSGLSDNYINAGFYIVNSERWREVSFLERYIAQVEMHNNHCNYLDECVLRDQCPFNMAIGGDVKLLPLTYNVQRWALGTHAWKHAAARHYTGKRKFLEPLITKTDRQEYALISELVAQAGIVPSAARVRDGGLTYMLNCVRRRADLKRREKALGSLEARRYAAHSFGSIGV
jgi:lipopolysaccharide biosynthesis glycosyltransferase